MNGSHYQDLLLYLEQTENEINRSFNRGAQTNLSEPPRNEKPSIKPEPKTKNVEDDHIDVDLCDLEQTNEFIKFEIAELLAKNQLNEDSISEYDLFNNNIKDYSYLSNNLENGISHDNISLENSIILSDQGAINVSTQTSPSISPSSTNLTWASECSSSPCLTSDSDLLDEDAHSSSSIDGAEVNCNHSKQRWQGLSFSAPILKTQAKMNRHGRSQSDRHLAEIEAAEACKWLRATGFPQYAQLYEDTQFPIDLSTAKEDHPLLEADVLDSLFRRLETLNNCAHLHQQRGASHTDESEDECCALSDNWTYQKDIRRWSRNLTPLQFPVAEENGKKEGMEKMFEKCTGSPKEKLRRAGSTKFRRRGVLFSERDSFVLDSLSKQLSDLKSCEISHVSDSEITPKHTRRSRTKSFDKSETWSLPTTNERKIWHRRESAILSPDIDIAVLDNSGPSMSSLSCTQLQVLRKLALLKLTAHIEKYCTSQRTGWSWDLPKFIRKIKAPLYKDKNVFGVPLTVTLQKTGRVLPKSIEEAIQWLLRNGSDQVGLFRKPGVKSRIQALRNVVESNSEIINYKEFQHYDVADMVKQYFRELPETLLTTKFSETFILIFQNIPVHLRRESVLCALLLMPDEHVEVLQALLHFLIQIGKESNVNQMNENNLAMCFAPSLFHYSTTHKQNVGAPHPKELAENKAGHECLLYFMQNFTTLFQIPKEFFGQCKSSEVKETKVVKLQDLGRDRGDYRTYLNECQQNFLKETREKSRGYVNISGHNPKIEISYKKVADGIPLRLWRVCADIEAPPCEVMHRILRERHIWDPELTAAITVHQVDKHTEIFQFARKKLVPLPTEEYCVVRMWRNDLPKDACLIIETSVDYEDSLNIPNAVRGLVYASRYLIEPCGSGKSRVIHLSRVDTMGKTPEWYQKNYGHLSAMFLANIQNSFTQHALGPESKV